MSQILITGASGVIGSAIARIFATPGRKIVLHYHRSEKSAFSLADELRQKGAEVQLTRGDLQQHREAARIVAEAFDAFGGIDLLVHAAALFERTPLGTVTEEQWDRILGLDLKAAFFLAQEAGMRMQTPGGRMIFLSDVAGERPYAGYLPYCIAKSGIDAMVRGLAKSLAPKVLVNAVAPYVVTRPKDFSDRSWGELLSKMPMQRPQTPDDIAAIVKMLAETGDALTGQVIAVDGGRLLK